ncbi:MAG TPA: carboxymuconolactone decarboxylase family protein [Elusimicrobiota bacterium]|nr:carboxymuconolactone decarboxylase family protein [Elusimicrobiota bacterium]
MSARANYAQQSPELLKKLFELSQASKAGSLGETLTDLVNIRASQLNGCAFCLDMHVKEAKLHGERELRVHHVAVWRESPLFSAKEKAALEWTETVTRLDGLGIDDEAYARARAQFSDKELTELTFAVAVINAWNRLSVAFQTVPGSLDARYGLDKAGLK